MITPSQLAISDIYFARAVKQTARQPAAIRVDAP
jgi:hypothetical protein